ncbi:hypothetical protein ACIQU6_15465 [Streptomyces sp. NPDC090442]|uniref:hypothetical protein n=1 Tax=Streptomyces sp. NPDC090442 TaxID=3365962 RepID=UPI003811AE72
MDLGQGWAAVLAGGIGMLGALGGSMVGGWAAVRGARDAAALNAETVRQQVADQAEIEHRHWVRQERQKAYREVLDAYAGVTPMIWVIHESLASQDESDWPERLDLTEEFDVLNSGCSRLVLLGPAPVAEAGNALSLVLHEVERSFMRLVTNGPGEPLSGGDRDRAVASMRTAVKELRAAYIAFMRESQRVLIDGVVVDGAVEGRG